MGFRINETSSKSLNFSPKLEETNTHKIFGTFSLDKYKSSLKTKTVTFWLELCDTQIDKVLLFSMVYKKCV